MTNIQRATTEVISVSLPKPTVKKLEKVRKLRGQSRSSYLANLIEKEIERERWERIFKKGRQGKGYDDVQGEGDGAHRLGQEGPGQAQLRHIIDRRDRDGPATRRPFF